MHCFTISTKPLPNLIHIAQIHPLTANSCFAILKKNSKDEKTMNILLYLYDNLLVILYACACLMAFCGYLNKRDKAPVTITVLFFCLLLNQLITSMAEFIPEFAHVYDAAYRNMPVFNTVISTVIAICLLDLFYLLVPDKKISRCEYIILLVFFLILLVIPTLKNSLVNLFLYSAVFLLYLLYRGITFCYLLHKKSRIHYIYSCAAVLLPLSGLIENFVKIFYRSSSGIDSYRIFSLDFLFGSAAASCIYTYMQKKAAPRGWEAAAKSRISESASCIQSGGEMDIFNSFCEAYGLTPREQTILSELLNHATYRQISDKLLISFFTVKTHVHSIRQKTGVRSKRELSELYERYKDPHPE